MQRTAKYLSDEHMQMYEWNGLSSELGFPRGDAKRTHAWHASYGVLAVLTTLLLLNGCDRQGAAEQASDAVGQTVQEQPRADSAAQPDSAEAAAPSAEGMSEAAPAATTEPPADNPGQTAETQQP